MAMTTNMMKKLLTSNFRNNTISLLSSRFPSPSLSQSAGIITHSHVSRFPFTFNPPPPPTTAAAAATFLNSPSSPLLHRPFTTGSGAAPPDNNNNNNNNKPKTSANLRPLSPHLPIYKAEPNSILSISNRISAVFLTVAFLTFHLLAGIVGRVSLTYEPVYQLMFYSSELLVVSAGPIVLSLVFHTVQGIRHLVADFSGFARKRLK